MQLLSETQNALVLAFGTTAAFILLNKIFIFVLPHALKNRISRPERLQSYEFVWKFSNILISLIHSAVSGVLCLYSVLYYPALHLDIIDAFEPLPYFALAFTIGYFLYDTYDIFVHRSSYSQYIEIVMHHIMIILNFGLALLEHRYVGSMVIGKHFRSHFFFRS